MGPVSVVFVFGYISLLAKVPLGLRVLQVETKRGELLYTPVEYRATHPALLVVLRHRVVRNT